MQSRKSLNLENKAFNIVFYTIFSIIFFICIYPFFYMFLVSISDSTEAMRHTITFWPLKPTLQNYLEVFKLNGLFNAFMVSVARTVIGTAITLFFTSIIAYTFTKKELVGRKILYRFVMVSMYCQAGIIPWYLVMRAIGMKDNPLVYVLPGAVMAYGLILIKTYIENIPPALEESAMIDGAGYFTIFIKIILPICKPVLAAVVVFTAVGQWNSWMDNLLLVTNPKLQTLQLTLLTFLKQSEAIATQAKANGVNSVSSYIITPNTVRITVTMVATLPILIVYPLVQKYFVSGILVGSVKG